MLAPRASSAYVCIRCELQLARRRLPAYTYRTSQANFSASARHPDAADELETQVPPPRPALKIWREIQPLDRVRKRQGRSIRETSTRLGGLKRLGDEAEILVLRELPRDENSGETETTVERAEPHEVPDIHASLQQEGRNPTPEEISDRIESLRPKSDSGSSDSVYVTQRVFLQRMRQLTEGFTQQQLAHYYSVVKNIKQNTAEHLKSKKIQQELVKSLKDGISDSKIAIPRTQWQPGTTSLKQRLPQFLPAARTKEGSVRKQLIVDRILRDVWRLVPQEEVESPGEIEMSLKPWQMTLLSVGDQEPALQKIGRVRRAKLEIDHKGQVLRITADKTTAEYAATDVEEALATTSTCKLNFKPWIPCLKEDKLPPNKKLATIFTQEDFDMVTSVTRTSVQRMDNANTLVIRGLHSDAVHEAERMLISLLPHTSVDLKSIDTQAVGEKKSTAQLLPVFNDEQSLSYTQRKIKLGRWSLPVHRGAAVSRADEDSVSSPSHERSAMDPDTTSGLVNRMIEALRRPHSDRLSLRPQDIVRREVGLWSPEPEYALSATFGQTLFPCNHPAADSRKDTLLRAQESVFKSATPGLSSLLNHTQIEATARAQMPNLTYNFIAAPEQQALSPGQVPPALRIQLRAKPAASAVQIRKVFLQLHNGIHTVLLPGQVSDIQFHTTGTLLMSTPPHHENMRKWIDTVSKNIASGSRLTAPPLAIEIPRWTIPGEKPDAKGSCLISYLFSGIKVKQTVTGDYEGSPVSYTAKQSGKMGARSGTLSIYHGGNAESPEVLLQDEQSLEEFVKKSFSMAEMITQAAARSQPILKTLRPRSEESPRKTRRLVLTTDAGETDEQSTVAVGGIENASVAEEGREDTQRATSVTQKSEEPEQLQKSVVPEEPDIHDSILGKEGAASTQDAKPISPPVDVEDSHSEDLKAAGEQTPTLKSEE